MLGNRVAALQMTSSADVAHNLSSIECYLPEIKDSGATLLVLPENFAYMGLHEKDKLKFAEPFGDGVIQETVSQWAKSYDLWIVAGTIPIQSSDPKRCYASTLVFDNLGRVKARYDKIHLFDVRVSETEAHKESNSTCAGDKVVVVDTPVGRLGLSVCYDLRFPELYRLLQQQGAEVLIVPAAFTYDTGKVHWQVLLQARAIENMCYVIAANQGGTHQNGRETYGHSMIISPWGEILSECDDTSIAVANIELSQLHKKRQQFPCLNHIKL